MVLEPLVHRVGHILHRHLRIMLVPPVPVGAFLHLGLVIRLSGEGTIVFLTTSLKDFLLFPDQQGVIPFKEGTKQPASIPVAAMILSMLAVAMISS